jgi:hypothetical protein
MRPGMTDAGSSWAGANVRRHKCKESAMNKYQVKGVAEKVKGNVNQAVGKATDDPARELTGSAGGRG